jgi:adenylylsulfate kinase-like enzyme
LQSAKIIWFTGLSGSGKTTLARKAFSYLKGKKQRVRIIDGDIFRNKEEISIFTPEGIIINNEKIIDLCQKMQNDYDYILVTVIAPFEKTRIIAKEIFKNNYIEVYVKAEMDTVTKRDTKGLYKKAMQGNLQYLIGLDSRVPYEEPVNPKIVIDTNSDNIQKSTFILISKINLLLNIS